MEHFLQTNPHSRNPKHIPLADETFVRQPFQNAVRRGFVWVMKPVGVGIVPSGGFDLQKPAPCGFGFCHCIPLLQVVCMSVTVQKRNLQVYIHDGFRLM